jgi:transposase
MYLRKCTNGKTGRTQLTIVQGYRDSNGKSKHKTILSLGYKDILEQEYEDPIAHFEQVARQMTEEHKLKTAPITLKINRDEILDMGTDSLRNFGYMVFSSLYHELEIDSFVKNRQVLTDAAFDHNAIFRFLIFARLINPGSKKSSYESKHLFFDRTAFELEDVYRALDLFARYKDDLQLWAHEKLQKKWGRDTSLAYYDVTNYYFEIDQADDLRKKGISKEHRPDPIVQMGLLTDSNGLPISYGLFPGNTLDKKTLPPMMRRLQEKFDLGRTIFVTDRGLVCGNNIAEIKADKNGYVMSYSIRMADSKFKAYVLQDYDYRATPEEADKLWETYRNNPPKPGSPQIPLEAILGADSFRIKTRLCPRKITITTKDGRQTKVTVDEKQVIYYSPAYAAKAKADRANAVAKAHDMVKNPSRYTKSTAKGATKYVKNIDFDPKTGEVKEDIKKLLSFDEDKLIEEEKYDGYYAIVSSERNESAAKILQVYKGLWEIEESFKITKHGISSRPVYVSKQEHIEAHFLTCFIALLLSRMLQKKLEDKYGVTTMLESLRKATCSLLEENLYTFHYYDEILKDIGEVFNIDFSQKYRTLDEIKKVLCNSKKL